MVFSPLTTVILPTTKYSSRGGRAITRAIIHNWHGMFGGVERLVYSKDPASANYIILSVPYKMPHAGYRLNGTVVPAGTVLPAGAIIGSVPEEYRAWTSGSMTADGNAITFEIQNDVTDGSGRISQAAWDATVRLLAEIANRRKWAALSNKTTVRGHKEFQPTSCPGAWLWPRMGQLAQAAQAARSSKTPTSKEGFLMALTDKQQEQVYDTILAMSKRVRQLKDYETLGGPDGGHPTVSRKILDAVTDSKGVGAGGRARTIQDLITGGGPKGQDPSLLREILAKLDGIESRLDNLEKAK